MGLGEVWCGHCHCEVRSLRGEMRLGAFQV